MKHIQLTALLLLLGFYLGLHNNHLTIFEDGRPVVILPYSAELYPNEDQNRLRQGIPFETNEELSALLENFIS